jgi:hypothetical protein
VPVARRAGAAAKNAFGEALCDVRARAEAEAQGIPNHVGGNCALFKRGEPHKYGEVQLALMRRHQVEKNSG